MNVGIRHDLHNPNKARGGEVSAYVTREAEIEKARERHLITCTYQNHWNKKLLCQAHEKTTQDPCYLSGHVQSVLFACIVKDSVILYAERSL